MKRLAITLCVATMLATTAFASNAPYPTSVEEFAVGEEYRIHKTYQLSRIDDPTLIPTEDFERNGLSYTLLDVKRTDTVGVDVMQHTEPVTQASKTKNEDEILTQLAPTLDVTTNEGYRRVTWSRNGTKRIVWQCTSRLDNGTKFCQHSPTMEEGKFHSRIMEQIHDFASTQQEVLPTLLNYITRVVSGQEDDGSEQLQDRLLEITNRQAILLEMVLEDMDNADLSAQMQSLAEEKKVLQDKLDSLAPKRPTQPSVESRVAQIAHWMQSLQPETQYSHDLVRQAIQQITVQDSETVGINFKGVS